MAKREILGVIPARGGSKGIARKNLVNLAGKPLIVHTCEAALASRKLTRVILSSDDAQIVKTAKNVGMEVPFLRPKSLAQDDTLIIDVLVHLLAKLRQQSYIPEYLALLQPTSPLRTAEHIDGAIDLMSTKNVDSVVSVVEIPHQFSPASLMSVKNGFLKPYEQGPMILRRQEKPRYYARNGPAILITRREIIENGQLYGETIIPYEMSKRNSVDIDTIDDLALAEFFMQSRSCEQ